MGIKFVVNGYGALQPCQFWSLLKSVCFPVDLFYV